MPADDSKPAAVIVKTRDHRLEDALEAEIAWHASELARLQQQADEELRVEIALTARGLAFTAADIITAATLRPTLQMLLAATHRTNAGRLGKFLKACEGQERAGVRIRRLAKINAGRLWVCDSVSNSHSDACRDSRRRV